jgi:2-C-methyl-D-erythritol 2,4-cyclodiphosphate synthase
MIWVGQGWDVHRFADGGPLRLGGVDIPFDRHLEGHSDGDVVLHAVADALLGATAAGDIGEHFPDSDPRLRGADSGELLRRVMEIVGAAGAVLVNVDVTVLAEQPRLQPFRAGMRERIACLLGVSVERVSVKAKTMERLGEIGQGRAIAAMAVAAVDRPPC